MATATQEKPTTKEKPTKQDEALKEVADREAAEAEAEHATLQTSAEAGEQGIATQEEPEDPEYTPPEPTEGERKAAQEVLLQLQSRVNDYGPQATIDALIQIVDRVEPFICPADWPGEEEDQYRESSMVQQMASFLLRGCRVHLEMSPRKLVCLWRNHENWKSKGKKVRGMSKSFSKRTRFLTDGALASIEINFHLFKTMNPLQKVATVYRALRELDAEGKAIAPDFEGYLDELELFGMRVFRDMVAMHNAAQRGLEVEHEHQLSLLDEMGDGEAATT